jgi:MYXO-CTERM domain-containing protein
VADYLACTENDDAQVGEAVLAPFGAVRDLEDTSKRCPDDMFGEPHGDGQIVGSYSWSVRALLGRARADELVWGAVATLPQGATLGDFGGGVLSAADAMVLSGTISPTERAEIETLLVARGLDQCDHVMPLEPGETKVESIFGLTEAGASSDYSCEELQSFSYTIQGLFHFARQTQISDPFLRILLESEPTGDGPPQLTVYLRKGDPVVYEGDVIFGLDAVEFDQKIDLDGESTAVLLEGADFEPGAEYFFVIENRGCPRVRISLTTETEEAPSTTATTSSSSSSTNTSSSTSSSPGANTGSSGGAGGAEGEGGGPQADADDDDGCDCRTVSPNRSEPTSPWALLGALVFLTSRRRSSRAEPARSAAVRSRSRNRPRSGESAALLPRAWRARASS